MKKIGIAVILMATLNTLVLHAQDLETRLLERIIASLIFASHFADNNELIFEDFQFSERVDSFTYSSFVIKIRNDKNFVAIVIVDNLNWQVVGLFSNGENLLYNKEKPENWADIVSYVTWLYGAMLDRNFRMIN